MKFKREIIAIILIICMLFTISAISAADSSTGAVSATNVTVEAASDGVANDNNLATENNVEILGEGEGSFIDLSDELSGKSEYKLERDYVYNIATDTGLSDGIVISNSITIDGQGHTIDAKGQSRIFYMYTSDSIDVTLKNITFVNGKSTWGGALVWYCYYGGNGNVINCTFINNTASGGDGGAIYNWYGLSNIVNSTFLNTFDSTSTVYLYSTSVTNCIFINNTQMDIERDGGTINANNNWFGNTVDNKDESPNIGSGVTVNNWYYLDLELDHENGIATVSLNNLYENGVVSSNGDYALPSIKFNVIGKNIAVPDSVTLENGEATISYQPTDAYSLTINYNGVELTREIKPTFKSLNDKIDSGTNQITLDQDYEYDSTKDSSLTRGIEFAKDMTIDGQGHIIDAKQSSNIFYFNDDTDSYSLTLKNIIFANATGTDGAAVYFKGKKIEIINCTFINNAATSQGDAIYIADASSNDNKITESLFTGNTGLNSIVYVNLIPSNSKLNLDNSIFVKNDATYNVKGTSNVILEYNWLGNTIENYDDNAVAKVDGVTLNNWLFLKIDATAAITGEAILSLNDLYDGSDVSTYDGYSLKPITFALSGSNARTAVSSITIDGNGQATYQFRMYKTTASLTVTHEDIVTNKELEYTIVDDGSFKALNDKIWFSSANDVIELTHDYVYSDSDTITDGILIPRTLTINGNGHKIDAKGKTRIFDIYRGVSNVNINDINFVNAKSTSGSVITIEYGADNVNIKNCNFTNNTATNYAGAIDCIGDYCTIDNCNFIYNTAASKAGAIRYYHDTQAYIKNSNFINNTVDEGGNGGGAIYDDDGKISISKSTFFNNSAKNMLGGTIYSKKAITISDSIILNSTGNYDIYDASGITIQNSWVGNTFDNYNTNPNVYYLSSYYSSWLYLNIKFYEDFAVVSLNEVYVASSGSSSIYSNYNLPEITLNINSTSLDLGGIDKITLDANGQAIVPYTKISEDAKLTVGNDYVSLTKECKVGDFDCLQNLIDSSTGNTIELTRNYTFIDGVDTLINGISITRDITIDGKGFTIDGSNLARILYITTNGVTLKNINFVNGYASHGGAIYNNGGSGFELINCTFENNVAYNNPGGAIYTYSNGVNNFINCTFIGNKMTKSGQYGGAIYIYEYSGRNNFIGCTFINNSAYYGGAIATASGKAITNVDKSVFVTNTANYYPSIYIKGGTSAEFYLKNSIIFSKGFTTDSSTQVYVANNLGAGDVDYNWWMHTSDNYKQNGYIRYSGGGLTVNKWLYLDLTCENEVATISFNNLYDKSTTTSSTYYGELPQITFDLSAVNAIVDSSVTLNKNGQGEVEYSLTDQTGSLTATYDVVSITKSLTYDDSFTTLQGKINRASEGSELVLTHGYTYDSTKDATLLDGIVIDKDLTIDGQGYTIDANNAARIFNIDDNTKNIVLKNIKFINAVGDNGAAINANCNNMEIINCTFENDQATANGDAIYLVANGCEITESIFINNIGTVSTVYLDSESDDATFNIANSILVNNGGTNVVKAKGDLTAEYNWWGNTVDNTGDLSNGLAQKWYVLEMTVDDAQSIASISLNNLNDGTTYENYALPTITLNIQATNANTRKDEVTLDENGDATVGYIVTDGSGIGTLTASYNGVSITKDINYNIDSDYSFKALKRLIDQANDNDVITLTHDYEYVVGYDDITTGSDAAITAGIDITQNNLTINGNGYTIDAKEKTRIFNVGVADHLYASNVTIKNTTFVNGKISGQGGAIRWYGWNGTLINCTFEDNTADNNYGGAVYWYAQYGNITNCTFKNNVVTGYYQGGAIYVQSKNVNVVNSTFIENKASNGGSIYINAENVTVINSTFVKSTAGNGGAIGVGKSNVIINNSTFTSNEASTYGGAVYLSSGNNIDIVGSTFNDNKATSYAGAIYSSVKFNIKNSTFKGNKANSYGGAIYYANGAGGTIYNTTFIDNSANKGGAIFTYAGVIDINKTDFINNTAQGSSTAYAGAIYDQSSDKLSIENSNFIGNYVKSGGNSAAYAGAIYTSYGEISITNSTFNKNSIENLGSGSCYGSVICWYNNAKGNIINSSFLNNHGKSSVSAAMYGDSAEVNITNSIFLNNTYGDSNTWRVIYRSVGTFNFTDCWFGNTVKNSGEDMGTPSGTGITKNNILELATVHDEYMAVGEDNQIKFVFQSRDSVIYDASKLPKINLTLSSVNGNLDKNSAAMDETILFNAKQFGPASITAKYNGIELTEDLYAKDKPTITVEEPIVVHVGESIGVNVIELIPSDASLSFSSIDGDEIISVTYNGYVEGLKEGTSTLYIKYNGNENYSPATVEVPVTVIKYNTQINVRIDTTPIDNIGVDYGADPQSITISFATDDPNPQYGEFDLEYKSNDTNVAVFTPNPTVINFANAGTANVTFYFEGSNRYNGCEKNITVTVRKVDSSVVISNDVEFDYLASGTTTLTLVGADSVSISVVGHDEAVIGYDDVTGVVTVSGLDVGSYTLKVTTTPDGNHNSVDATAAVTVNKIDSSLEFSGNVVFDYLGTGSTTLINIVGCRIDLVNISVVGHDEAVIGYDDVTGVVTVS
ncbi:MAG: right-handed parallel beta-helix repeat-containing protein, partial [Methanobrevibacter sp.]|nr:right-handed parallel beta-helix repeat-containing protein [Methanobrevibacter sp.]